MKKIFVLLMMALATTCNLSAKSNFVQVKNGHFVRDGKPYYYVGTNFWYGAILGSEGQGGDRNRLCKELDKMKEMGIDNLRILVGSDGKRGVKTKVEPTLQEAPGVYNDTILAGLDYLLMEMGKRKMLAVLYLNNSWEWSGGYGYYLEQAGLGQAPRPNEDGYPAFMNFVAKYASCEKAHQLFYDYVKFILTRTNRYTKKKYKDDPAIMSWQIGNEPRAFSKEQLPAFEKWLGERDGYYKYVFSLVGDNAASGGYFAGCNFWGWGGFANPKHEQWQVGDDYTGDPAQEAQGLNSVFSSDKSTLQVVKTQVDRMNRIGK